MVKNPKYYVGYVFQQCEFLKPYETFQKAEKEYFELLTCGCCHILIDIKKHTIYYNIDIYPDSLNPLVVDILRQHNLHLRDINFCQKDAVVYDNSLNKKYVDNMIDFCENIYEKMTRGLVEQFLFEPTRDIKNNMNRWLKEHEVPYTIITVKYRNPKVSVQYDCGLVVQFSS